MRGSASWPSSARIVAKRRYVYVLLLLEFCPHRFVIKFLLVYNNLKQKKMQSYVDIFVKFTTIQYTKIIKIVFYCLTSVFYFGIFIFYTSFTYELGSVIIITKISVVIVIEKIIIEYQKYVQIRLIKAVLRPSDT